MTMITPSYLGETIEYSSLHACRSTLEDPTLPPSTSNRAPYPPSGKPPLMSSRNRLATDSFSRNWNIPRRSAAGQWRK